MRKIFFFLTPLLIITIVFLLIVLFVNRDSGKGALQVTSIPSSQVFLDGKFIGKAPLCLCDLPQLLNSKEYKIKLVPMQAGFQNFEQKITVHPGVLTVVDRTFDKQVSMSSASVITLSKIENENNSELLLVSFPDKSQVILDSNPMGNTPLLLKDITESDHEVKILKEGYREKIIKVKTVKGKRLEATIFLGIKTDINTADKDASSSAVNLTTQKVLILDTPTGFLRVRQSDSVSSDQIATVSPGEKYDLISEKGEWLEIRLPGGKSGWISASFAQKEQQ